MINEILKKLKITQYKIKVNDTNNLKQMLLTNSSSRFVLLSTKFLIHQIQLLSEILQTTFLSKQSFAYQLDKGKNSEQNNNGNCIQKK